MGDIIASLLFGFMAILSTILAVALLRGKRWKLLMFSNPILPNGQRRYDEKKQCASARILLIAYASVFLLSSVVTALTRVWFVLPSGFLTATLYLHGAVLALSMILYLIYLDTCCQNELPVPQSAEEPQA